MIKYAIIVLSILALTALMLSPSSKGVVEAPMYHWVCRTKQLDTFEFVGRSDPYFNTVIDTEGFERDDGYTMECKSKPVAN